MKRTYLKDHAFRQTARYCTIVKVRIPAVQWISQFPTYPDIIANKQSIYTLQKASYAIQSP